MKSVPVQLSPTHTLTPMQRALWSSQRRVPDSPLQNMVHLVHLDGAVDADRLAAAFSRVVAASDAFRTRIVERDGEPVVSLDAADSAAIVLDMDRDEAEAWARERAARPLDMTRCGHDSVVLRHTDGTCSWYLALHHTITDATTHGLVLEATATAYAGQEPVLESYYQWAETVADPSDDRVGRALRHWDARPAMPRVGRLYQPVRSPVARASREDVLLDSARTEAIGRRLAGEYAMLTDELAWTTLLIATTAVYVKRLTGVDTLSIGMPVHNRSSPAARGLLGALVEVFPVDVTIRADDTFASLHRRVGRSVLQTLRHAMPGTAPPGDYEAIVNVISATTVDHFGEIPATTTWIHSGAIEPSHLLRVQLTNFGSDVGLALDINHAAADPVHRERAGRHFGTIVDQFVAQPDARVGSSPMLTDEEAELMARWGSGEPARSATSITGRLRQSLADRDDIAMEADGRTWTGAELWAWVERLAADLRRRGVGPGTRVGIELPRSGDAVAAILATLAAGGSYVPLDPSHPRQRLDDLTSRAGCHLVLTRVPAIRELADDATIPARVPLDAPFELAEPLPTDEAYLLFTSGSTGEPKGVPISHEGLARYIDFAAARYTTPVRPPVAALFSALTFDLTVTSLFVPLVTGGRLVVIDADGPAGLADIASRPDITWLKATPSHLEILVRLLPSEGHDLATVVVGGEAFGSDLARRLMNVLPDASVFNEYGPTEAVVGCMIHRVDRERLHRGPEVPIGRPAPGVDLRVVDGYDHPAPIGATGELLISHPGMTAGYLDAEHDVGRWLELDGKRWYRSGDLVRLADPDTLVYLGRIDEQVKVGGVRLEPVEVEAALTAHPAIETAAVRLWSPTPVSAARACVRCGLPSNVPGARIDEQGVCATCHDFDRIRETTASYFRTIDDLADARDSARALARGPYDCLHLLSGGKDSTYALYQLVELGWRPYVLTLDNGYISEAALDNVRQTVADLGLDHEIATTPVMDAIFRDSLERHSNVCNGCYKTIYTLATNRAVALGIPVIVTGLSRGQLFETRLVPKQFEGDRFDPDAIDRAVVEARKAYHRVDDAPRRLLDTSVFDDDDIFDRITYLDFYRYVDVELADMLAYLDASAPWVRPSDTGRSTNCLINAAGIHTHLLEQGYHNYAEPYAWDVRLGHKTRSEAMAELDDRLDIDEVARLLDSVGYEPSPREILTAWVQLAEGWSDAPSPAELRTHLATLLPAHAIPSAFVTVSALPLNTNGKLDTAALPAPERVHRPGPAMQVAPESEVERLIVDLWEATLGVEPVGVEDDFFALGGDSLAALHMVMALSDRMGAAITEELAFVHTTPRALAAAVGAGVSGGQRTRVALAKTPRSGPPPLTDGEQAILFDQAMHPESVRYNVGRLHRVPEPFDADGFVRALVEVADLHSPLTWTYGTPRRRLTTDDAVSVETGDGVITEASMLERAEVAHRRPFDLDRGPLLRCWLQRVDDGTTAVLLSFHHVAGDAASFDRIWRHVDQLMAGADVAPPSVDMGDVAAWQRTTRSEEDRRFWLDAAPTERPGALRFERPSNAEPDGFLLRVASVSPAQLRSRTGATGFAIAAAGLAAALGEVVDGDRVGFGIVASTRNDPALDPMVGYFLNTLPITLPCGPEETLRSLTSAAAAQVGAALAHRGHPLAEIVSDRRDAALPLPQVEVLLAYDELPPVVLDGRPVEHRVLFNGDAVADVTFFVEVRDDRVDLSMEYRGSVVRREDAEWLLRRLDDTVHRIISEPDRPAIPADADTARIVNGPEPGPTPLVLGSILEHVQTRSSSAAVVHDGRVWTWDELDRRSAELAGHLLEAGVSPGARVVICQSRSFDLVASVVAVLRVGASYVPIDPSHPSERVGLLGSLADAHAALVGPGLPPLTPADLPVAELGPAGPDVRLPVVEVGADHVAYVMFTSGSTGTPRGVPVTHGQLAASNAARAMVYGEPSDVFLLVSSLAFDSSIAGLFWTLGDGGTLVVPTDAEAHDPVALVRLIETHRATHTLMVPTLYRAVLDRGDATRWWPAQVVVAGEACPPSLVARHAELRGGSRLTNEYGPTETTVWATAHHCTSDDQPVPIGEPIPGWWIAVVDEHGRPRPDGVVGELVIGGRGLTAGYLGDSETTAARYVTVAGQRCFATGDLAVIRSGCATFLGRADDQLNIGGVRAEPAEIERVLADDPAVASAVVVAIDPRTVDELLAALSPDDVRVAMAAAAGADDPNAALRTALQALRPTPPTLVAHVEPRPGHEVDVTALRTAARVLPPLLRPTHHVLHETLPRTPNGKLDRQSLHEAPLPPVIPHAGASGDASDDALAHRLARLFADMLRLAEVGVHESFFEAGGHSLSALALLDRVLDETGAAVTVASFYEAPTPAGLAAAVRRFGPSPDTEQYRFLLPIQPLGSQPPIVCVHVLGPNASFYRPLAARMGNDQPMIGLVMPHVVWDEAPRTLDDVVQRYADELDRYDATTPVTLAGVSLGSVVAVELGRELQRRGRCVHLVAMFDAAGPDAAEHVPGVRARVGMHVRELRDQGWRYVGPRIRHRGDKLQRNAERLELEIRERLGRPLPTRSIVRRYIEDNLRFMTTYDPEPYPGAVSIFKAAEDPFLDGLARQGMGWASMVTGRLEVIDTPGDHLSMLTEPHVAELADALRAAIARAQAATTA